MDSLSKQEDEASSEYDKSELGRRRGALTGTVAVIRVGGATETEIAERKDRVDDAVSAVRCAMAEGIVAGGGTTLARLADKVEAIGSNGALILSEALRQPFRIILDNAGANPDKWLPKMLERKRGYGVDVKNPTKLVDLMSIGVIDPVMVTKMAVQYAVSEAGANITMGALIVDIPQEVKT